MLPPATELLKSAHISKPAWAVFDAAWYLARYEEARLACEGDSAVALTYYLSQGYKLRHSPSRFFDEVFYCDQNPDIVELIKAGAYQSGFDHFCQHGHRLLSPHWLFDDHFYSRLYEDMSLENLDQHGFSGRYDHYLRSGQFENRCAHYLFDPVFYRQKIAEAAQPDSALEQGPYTHYLDHLLNGGPEIQPSIYFDPQWFVDHHAGVRVSLVKQGHISALQHYLCNPNPDLYNPVAEFFEAYYRESNPDIKNAVLMGDFRCGYEHFVKFGAFELRKPSPDIDLVYYLDMNPKARDDLNTGLVRDAFAHLRSIGLSEKLIFKKPETDLAITEAAAKRLFVTKAVNQLPNLARLKLNFTYSAPDISVVIVLFNRFELTMLSLSSLRNNFSGEIELIIIDNFSDDQTKMIHRFIEGAVIKRLPENIGFLDAANIGIQLTTAPITLLLNNDIELGYGAIKAAIARLQSAPDIGAVGGKILRSHGLLQEAGSIIWNDGSTSGYMRDGESTTPEVNFIRQVDFCSGVFLACKTASIKSLGGFDPDYSPSYYEDVDLCVRLSLAGDRIIYDPAILVHHLEYGSAASSEATAALMRRGQKIFASKHQKLLASKYVRNDQNIVYARAASANQKKILFIEDKIPLRHLGSGFVRSNDVVNAIASLGYEVSVFPLNQGSRDVSEIYSQFSDSVEVLYNSDINRLQAFLSERLNYYDIIWVTRTHNLTRIMPILEVVGILRHKIKLILDTEAISATRQAARYSLEAPEPMFNMDAALVRELSFIDHCHEVLTVSKIEANLLKRAGVANVSVLGTMKPPSPTSTGFSERRDLLFVASIHDEDSPTLDALHWFRSKIAPALAEYFEVQPILNFVGYIAPDIDLSAFSGDPNIRIHGAVADLRPYYEVCRVFIAPTRFAAGTPYKIYETASFGLPSVVTDLLATQLGWQNGDEVLSAPVAAPAVFARRIAELYNDEILWTKIRNASLRRLQVENTQEAFVDALKAVIDRVCGAKSLGSGKGRPSRKPVAVR